MKNFFKNKKIIVIGGTGSIGAEIVKQLINFEPKVIRIFSRDETKQVYLQEALDNPKCCRFLIGDIRNLSRLKRAMEDIDIVFHAAALKHVPLCEYNPFEAVQTNVVGTQNVIEAALDCKVKKVIMISTDKAICPTNTMGATKLLGEKIICAANLYSKKTIFSCVRFGNVIGSRGSIVPLIERQVKTGHPVTITHPEMTRFTMSIKDAVSLVIKAAYLSKGGEKFILKMKSMKILDLIEILRDYFCKKYNISKKIIPLKTIGLRPGERLEEHLISDDELEWIEDRENMFIVMPFYSPLRRKARILPADYISSKAPQMSKEEIVNLLKDAGIIDSASTIS